MTWLEARAFALAGRRVRRAVWSDRWITYSQSLFYLQPVNPGTFSDGTRRVVQSADFGLPEFLATDWTLTAMVGAPPNQADNFPATLPGLILWLQPPASGAISELDYLGPTLYQTDTTKQPVSSGTEITFAGDDFVRSVNTVDLFVGTTISVFLVASRTDLSAADRAFLDLVTLNSIRTIGTGPKLKVTYLDATLGPRQQSTATDHAELHSLAVIGLQAAPGLSVRINGVDAALAAASSNAAEYAGLSHVNEFAVGSLADGVTAPHIGAIREVLYYTPALAAEDYLSLETHLLTKHGLGA